MNIPTHKELMARMRRMGVQGLEMNGDPSREAASAILDAIEELDKARRAQGYDYGKETKTIQARNKALSYLDWAHG